jgi:hypothetical protein
MNRLTLFLKSPPTGLFITICFAVGALVGEKGNLVVICSFSILLLVHITLNVISTLNKKIRRRMWKLNVMYKTIAHDWRINENGDFQGLYHYTVRNIGKKAISVIPYDDAYWLINPKKFDIKYRVCQRNGKKRIIQRFIQERSYMEWYLQLLGLRKAFHIWWSLVIDPPLEPQEEMEYELEIFTPETEKGAFEEGGTYAGIPCNIPTEEVNLVLSGPIGYRFRLLAPAIVIDKSGKSISSLEEKIEKPKVAINGTSVRWLFKYPKTDCRYIFQYRLEKVYVDGRVI